MTPRDVADLLKVQGGAGTGALKKALFLVFLGLFSSLSAMSMDTRKYVQDKLGQAGDEACLSALGPLQRQPKAEEGQPDGQLCFTLCPFLMGSLGTKPHLFLDQQDRVSETSPPRQLRG